MNAHIHHLFRCGEPASAARMALYGFVRMESLSVKVPEDMQLARVALPAYGAAALTQQQDPLPGGPWSSWQISRQAGATAWPLIVLVHWWRPSTAACARR